MTKPSRLRIAVLGGGPVGVEAALYASSLGINVTLFEQGQIGESVNRWGFLRMFTPFGVNASPLGKRTLADERHSFPADTVLQTGREFRDTYLLPLGECSLLNFTTKVHGTVIAVGRTGWRRSDTTTTPKLPPFRLLVRSAEGQESAHTADAVLDCTGTLGRPNWLGDGGVPAIGEMASRPHIAYWPEDVLGAKRNHYLGRHTVVVGSGHTAAAVVCGLMELAEENPSTWVTWLTREPRTQPIVRIPNDPFRDRDRLAVRANSLATRCEGNLEHHPHAEVQEVHCAGNEQGFRICAKVNGVNRTWEAERVIANIGYRPDLGMTGELRVGEPTGDVRSAEPGYYLLGAKSRGRDSSFLLCDAHDQIRRVFADLMGNGKLNLYAA